MGASIRDSLIVRVAERETMSLLRNGADAGTPAGATAGDLECCSEGAMSDSESEICSTAESFVAQVKPKQERRAFQHGFLKRTYGDDLAYDSSLKRRLKSAKLDEQLDGLRAALPDVATSLSTERTAILLDAYHYIATLQRQVDDLNAQLLDDASTSSTQTQPADTPSHEGAHCSHSVSYHSQEPVVDVAKRNGLLEVRVVCANRPGLLVNIMEAIESRGLTIAHSRIACHNEIVVEYLSLENQETQEAESAGEEEERVKTMLLYAICRGKV